jgi:hypothetical protein
MRDGGKGDAPRPLGVTMEQFDKNFDAIFKKKPVKTYTGDKPNYVIDKPKEDIQNANCNGV